MEKMVIKIGGSILGKLPDSFYRNIVRLKTTRLCEPIIVHGGGPEINRMLEQLNVKSNFINGLRVTTKEVLDIAEMVMTGSINKSIVTRLQKAGHLALGVSGVDGSLLIAEPVHRHFNLGFVGKVKRVNKDWLEQILNQQMIPVISPIGADENGQKYNINGDMAASAVAAAMNGKLIFISDIPGVMENVEGKAVLHSELTKEKIETLVAEKVIHGGMIPKVQSAVQALTEGVQETVILNGLQPEDLLKFVQGKKAGTKILLKEEQHV